MTFIIWVIRALVILFILRLVLRMFTTRSMAGAGRHPNRRAPERLGGTLVRDPNCGTHIVRERAIMSGSGEAAVYFCSKACRDAWLVSRKS